MVEGLVEHLGLNATCAIFYVHLTVIVVLLRRRVIFLLLNGYLLLADLVVVVLLTDIRGDVAFSPLVCAWFHLFVCPVRNPYFPCVYPKMYQQLFFKCLLNHLNCMK